MLNYLKNMFFEKGKDKMSVILAKLDKLDEKLDNIDNKAVRLEQEIKQQKTTLIYLDEVVIKGSNSQPSLTKQVLDTQGQVLGLSNQLNESLKEAKDARKRWETIISSVLLVIISAGITNFVDSKFVYTEKAKSAIIQPSASIDGCNHPA